jgi:hypothetical protein
MVPLLTPIAFFIFNRPETTNRVFEMIRKVQPKQLFIIADSPRFGVLDDIEKCREVRDIVKNIDWECEVLHNYAIKNLGCRDRISSGIDWVFNHVEYAIILEDDCLPTTSFFEFCQILLAYYADDEEILAITGTNLLKEYPISESYTFSYYPLVWGWATWRRSWKHYDVKMKEWENIDQKQWLAELFNDKKTAWNWRRNLESTYRKRVDTWDFQWFFSCWLKKGLIISPQKNLVSNIGFGADATHTKWSSEIEDIQRYDLDFPLIHPKSKIINEKFDRLIQEKAFNISFYVRVGLRLLYLLENFSITSKIHSRKD